MRLRKFLGRLARPPLPGPEPLVPRTVLNRPLSVDEDAALRWILHVEDLPGSDELRTQIDHAIAVYGRTTELDLRVDGGGRAEIPDGHFPSTALVVDEREQPTGHIDLWDPTTLVAPNARVAFGDAD